MLITRAQLKPAEEVLILGAQWRAAPPSRSRKVAGARVIAAAGSEPKLAKAKELGADEAILHSNRDSPMKSSGLQIVAASMSCSNTLAMFTWETEYPQPRGGRRLVTCGATTGPEGKFESASYSAANLSILGTYMGSKAELFAVLELVGRGLLKAC